MVVITYSSCVQSYEDDRRYPVANLHADYRSRHSVEWREEKSPWTVHTVIHYESLLAELTLAAGGSQIQFKIQHNFCSWRRLPKKFVGVVPYAQCAIKARRYS